MRREEKGNRRKRKKDDRKTDRTLAEDEKRHWGNPEAAEKMRGKGGRQAENVIRERGLRS